MSEIPSRGGATSATELSEALVTVAFEAAPDETQWRHVRVIVAAAFRELDRRGVRLYSGHARILAEQIEAGS